METSIEEIFEIHKEDFIYVEKETNVKSLAVVFLGFKTQTQFHLDLDGISLFKGYYVISDCSCVIINQLIVL